MRKSEKSILAVALGPDSYASTRVRLTGMLDVLNSRGWRIRRLSCKTKLWPILFLLMALQRPRLIVIQKAMPSRLLTPMIRLLSRTLVYEIDDAIYLGYPGSPGNPAAAKAKVRAISNAADKIIVSNNRISADLRRICATPIAVFPGPAPTRQSPVNPSRDSRTVIWLGSPSTIVNLREQVYPCFDQLANFRIRLIGAPSDTEAGNVTEMLWTPERQESSLRSSHIGLNPLIYNEWNARKAAYKVLEYLAHDVIPVSEITPALTDLLGAEVDILCSTVLGDRPADWHDSIVRASQRAVDGEWIEARDRVFERLSVERYADLFLEGIKT